MSDVKRPILVTLIGGLYFLLGLLMIVYGALIVAGFVTAPGTDAPMIEIAGRMVPTVSVSAIIVGFIPLIIGYGFLKGWRIIWILGVIFAILGLVASALTLYQSFVGGALNYSGIGMLVINLIILFYLTRHKVKTFFKM